MTQQNPSVVREEKRIRQDREDDAERTVLIIKENRKKKTYQERRASLQYKMQNQWKGLKFSSLDPEKHPFLLGK